MQQRTYWVDYARAIGIILVVYGHVAAGIYNAGIKVPYNLYVLANSVVYSFHMPLFFFLSGLFFYKSISKHGNISVIFSKIDTVVYPCIVWSVLQGLVESLLSKYTNAHLTPGLFELLWPPRLQFWFLYVLFMVVLIGTIMYSTYPKNPRKAAVVILALSVLAYIYQSSLPSNILLGYISSNFVYFAFGVIFSFYGRYEKLSNISSVCFWACAFIVSQYVFHITLGFNCGNKGIASLVLALVSIAFVISISGWASATQIDGLCSSVLLRWQYT